ncbi:MAG: hypothetical protein IT382_11230 [Deltaproteobacteria bacterium]|nr:hypothetical protein [Deltaproteobacteria bacterium]
MDDCLPGDLPDRQGDIVQGDHCMVRPMSGNVASLRTVHVFWSNGVAPWARGGVFEIAVDTNGWITRAAPLRGEGEQCELPP